MKSINLFRLTIIAMISCAFFITSCNKNENHQESSSADSSHVVPRTDKIDSTGGSYYDSTAGGNPQPNTPEEKH